MTIRTRPADMTDLDDLAELFCAYLHFYDRAHPRDRARAYLADRISRGESVVHVAEQDGHLVGFTQCYPTWSSLDLDMIWVLEDLFVAVRARRAGVAGALLDAVVGAAQDANASGLVLETQHGNVAAIGLYESFGFGRDDEFATYALDLPIH